MRVMLWHDGDVEHPSEYGGWKLYSFCRRHIDFKDPELLGLGDIPKGSYLPKVLNPGLRRKLDTGFAFICSYYEHGNCSWFLYGEGAAGVEFQWDGVRVAGLLVWTDKPKDLIAKTREARAEYARRFLQYYTDWANGELYWCRLADGEDDDLDGIDGASLDEVEAFLVQYTDQLQGNVDVEGDASDLYEYIKPQQKGLVDG